MEVVLQKVGMTLNSAIVFARWDLSIFEIALMSPNVGNDGEIRPCFCEMMLLNAGNYVEIRGFLRKMMFELKWDCINVARCRQWFWNSGLFPQHGLWVQMKLHWCCRLSGTILKVETVFARRDSIINDAAKVAQNVGDDIEFLTMRHEYWWERVDVADRREEYWKLRLSSPGEIWE